MAKKAPKTTQIRTEPVSLNESTLETNIASEIAALFNSPFNFGYPLRLRWLFGFDRVNFSAFRKRKTKLYRLTPTEENQGGGWDTKITIPTGRGNSRAIFIQFKRGSHSIGNNIVGSIFNLSIKNPNPNAEFTFNDNTSKNPSSSNNQHKTLKDLSDHLEKNGISSKSVMYGFPRITKLADFDKLEDDLLLYTTFVTISEIDAEAKNAKSNLYDGKTHHFRTCYFEEDRREISSDIFELKNPDEFENVLYEIILVKLAHLKNSLSKDFSKNYANEELFLMLAVYLKINPSDLPMENFYLQPFREEIRNYLKQLVTERDNNFYEIFGVPNPDQNPFTWRERLFKRVVEFFNLNQQEIINIQSDIPSEYTFNLRNQEEIKFDLGVSYDISMLIF